ncbi:hypothetical protein POVWA2_013890 [Plasmodium ovale wallikeri]|uniref:Uncharacterized protein n=1 Tax=Plasmodium ovale wallikeri TaxID=864142 RepID=A0A1A8YP46_PLAOA|nr:hypothetical protein POVWA2_013890 [Plasmodium ovale wallikeri]
MCHSRTLVTFVRMCSTPALTRKLRVYTKALNSFHLLRVSTCSKPFDAKKKKKLYKLVFCCAVPCRVVLYKSGENWSKGFSSKASAPAQGSIELRTYTGSRTSSELTVFSIRLETPQGVT